MAWREMRAGWREFVGFVACITLGVAALAAVGTFAANLERALTREAKALLGADVEIRSTRPFDAETARELERLTSGGATVTRVRELAAMARDPASGRTLLVELKAVEGLYPLFGRLVTSPPAPLGLLVEGGSAIVGDELLGRLGVRVGDRLTIGSRDLIIRGVVAREPDRPATLVSLGPRVFLAPADLDRAGLIRLGSRVRYRALLRLAETERPHEVRDALARAASDPAIRVTAFDESRPGLRQFLSQVTTYLGLVGLVSLLVGGLGVASSVTTFLRRRIATIAILKCLGADSRALLATYLVQTLALGVAGSVVGAMAGLGVQPLLVRLLAGVVPLEIHARPDVWTLVRAMAMGTMTTLLTTLPPLLRIRAVRPSLILRRDVEPHLHGLRRPWITAATIAVGLGALVLWQAGSLKIGGIFIGASVAALVVLGGLARGLVVAARTAQRTRGLAVRHGIANLHRPGGQTGVVVIALGVGVMLLVAVALLEKSLSRQLDHAQREQVPTFFFIDLQTDQRDAFVSLVRRAAGDVTPTIIPVVRARVAAVDGVPVTRAAIERKKGRERDRSWYFTRDYLVTYAEAPPAANELVRGRWWTASEAAARPRVSVEEDAAKALGVDVGHRLTFDVLGTPVEAEVMSLRKVDWESFSTNFFVIFSQGALDGAPTTFVASARVPVAAEAAVQNSVVSAFPNITAIPVRDVLDRLSVLLDQLSLAVRIMALFSIAGGVVVMVGALTASRYQRLYESVILRTLGATRATVARTFAVEYGCLGIAAGLGGTLLATVLDWSILRFVLDLPWTFEPGALALGVTLTTSMAVAIGFFATFRLLGEKPLAVLRRE